MGNIAALNNTRVIHGLLIDIATTTATYYISNLYAPVTYLGNSYIAMGHFLQIGEIQDDLKSTNNSLSIALSGIPPEPAETGSPNAVTMMLQAKIKGSLVTVRRAFFDLNTGALLTDQVATRFRGYISNFTITDTMDPESRTVVNTVNAQVSSVNAVLERQLMGRRTNLTDQRRFYPGDNSMDRVTEISGRSFQFGKPYEATGTGPGSGGAGPRDGVDEQVREN